VKERPYKVLGYDSKKKIKFGVSFSGKGKDENNATLSTNWKLYPGYWVQGKWMALAGKKQNPVIDYGFAGTESSTGLTAQLRFTYLSDLSRMGVVAYEDGSEVSGSTHTFDNLELSEGRLTGEFWIQSNASGPEMTSSGSTAGPPSHAPSVISARAMRPGRRLDDMRSDSISRSRPPATA